MRGFAFLLYLVCSTGVPNLRAIQAEPVTLDGHDQAGPGNVNMDLVQALPEGHTATGLTPISAMQASAKVKTKIMPGLLILLGILFGIAAIWFWPIFLVWLGIYIAWEIHQTSQNKNIKGQEEQMAHVKKLTEKTWRTYEDVEFVQEEMGKRIDDCYNDIIEYRAREKKQAKKNSMEYKFASLDTHDMHIEAVVGGKQSKYNEAYEQFVDTRTAYFKQKRAWKMIGRRVGLYEKKLQDKMMVFTTGLIQSFADDGAFLYRLEGETRKYYDSRLKRFGAQVGIQEARRDDKMIENVVDFKEFEKEIYEDTQRTRAKFLSTKANTGDAYTALQAFQNKAAGLILRVRNEVGKPTLTDLLIAQGDVLVAAMQREADKLAESIVPKDESLVSQSEQHFVNYESAASLLLEKIKKRWSGVIADTEKMGTRSEETIRDFEGAADTQAQLQEAGMIVQQEQLRAVPRQLLALQKYMSKSVSETENSFKQEAMGIEQAASDESGTADEEMTNTIANARKTNKMFGVTGKLDISNKLLDWLYKNTEDLEDEIKADGQEDKEIDTDVDGTRPRDNRNLKRMGIALSNLMEDWTDSKLLLTQGVVDIPRLKHIAAERKANGTNALHETVHDAETNYADTLQSRSLDLENEQIGMDHEWYELYKEQTKKLAKAMWKIDQQVDKEKSEMERVDAQDFQRSKYVNMMGTGISDAQGALTVSGRELLKAVNEIMSKQDWTREKLKDKLNKQYPLAMDSVKKEVQEAKHAYAHGFEQLQGRFETGATGVSRSIPVMASKVTGGIAKAERLVGAEEKQLDAAESTITDSARYAAQGIGDTANTFKSWNNQIKDDGKNLQEVAMDGLIGAEQRMDDDVEAADLPRQAQDNANQELQKLLVQLSQVAGMNLPDLDKRPVEDTVHAVMLITGQLQKVSQQSAEEMGSTIERLTNLIRSSTIFTEEQKAELLSQLDKAASSGGLSQHMADKGAAVIDSATSQIGTDASNTLRTLQSEAQAESFDAQGVQHDLDGGAKAVLNRAQGFEDTVNAAKEDEEAQKAKQDHAASKLATHMLVQAQEMQKRHLDEQDTMLGAYKGMGEDLENLQKYVDRLNGKVVTEQHAADRAAYGANSDVADSLSGAARSLTNQVGGVEQILAHDATDLDGAQLQLRNAGNKMAAHLDQMGEDLQPQQAGKYLWMLEDSLTDLEKQALNQSTTKIGDMVDEIANAFDDFPPVEKMVMAQADLKTEITNHANFLMNAAKGGGQKVMAVLDELLFEQDESKRGAADEVSKAEHKLDHDLPHSQDLPDPEVPVLGEVKGLIVGGAQSAKANAIGKIEAEHLKDKQLQVDLVNSQVENQKEVAELVKEGGDAAMDEAEKAREEAEEKLKKARDSGASAAEIYLGMDSQAQQVDEMLVQIAEALGKLSAPGIEGEPVFRKAGIEMDALAAELKRMPRVSASSLAELSQEQLMALLKRHLSPTPVSIQN